MVNQYRKEGQLIYLCRCFEELVGTAAFHRFHRFHMMSVTRQCVHKQFGFFRTRISAQTLERESQASHAQHEVSGPIIRGHNEKSVNEFCTVSVSLSYLSDVQQGSLVQPLTPFALVRLKIHTQIRQLLLCALPGRPPGDLLASLRATEGRHLRRLGSRTCEGSVSKMSLQAALVGPQIKSLKGALQRLAKLGR